MSTKRARRLRRDSTEAEKRLWRILRSRQFLNAKFRRQQPIGPYIVDFVSFEKRFVVEVDGGQHAEDDSARTLYLQSSGYRVIRFWNNEVLENIDGVLHTIATAVETE
ncbi:MAG: DUF559 domain-containing protein [Alphaproteobacteria bacterium]|jgi:very-short-patch-repair endonuclease|nr:DUF559 domain-containing protein [Alphaproteobacteria bacterium]